MTKKSTEELIAEAKDLKKRLAAMKEIEAVKKEREALENEVRTLHRATSTKWKILKKLGEKGKEYGKEAGKFFIEETRNLIDEESDYKGLTPEEKKKRKEEEGESLL